MKFLIIYIFILGNENLLEHWEFMGKYGEIN